MKKFTLPILTFLTLIGLSVDKVHCQMNEEPGEKFARDITAFEMHVTPGTGSSETQKKEIALLCLELEEMRLKYARQLQLNAEGIVAANAVQTARADYEKVQVQLASKFNGVKQTIKALEKQRKLANDFQKTIATSLGHGREISERTALDKPAPSEKPGKAPDM